MAIAAIREMWQYRELFYFLVWRDIQIRYRQTLLGAAWAIIQPFFAMIVFTLFFGNMAKMPSDGIAYPIFFYSTLLPWTFFSGAITFSGNSLISNAQLIRKVYFPRITLPVSSALGGFLDFAIAYVILLGMMVYYHIPLSWSMFLWVPLMLQILLMALGIGMFLAALNVKYRDVKYAIPFIIQIWLFVTPIIWPLSMVPEKYRALASLNPLAGVMEAFRNSLLGRPVQFEPLLFSLAATLVVLAVGALYFRQTERSFSDTI